MLRTISQEQLKEILAKHQLWLIRDLKGERADLRSADLRSADLSSADLRFADLRSADLRSADLRFADLSSADLRSADLRSADLSSADLSSADLSSADLRSADLRSADLRFADLSSADLSSADLSSGVVWCYNRIWEGTTKIGDDKILLRAPFSLFGNVRYPVCEMIDGTISIGCEQNITSENLDLAFERNNTPEDLKAIYRAFVKTIEDAQKTLPLFKTISGLNQADEEERRER